MNKKSFVGRKRARRYALQALYGWSMSGNALADVERHFLEDHAEDEFDIDYFKVLIHEVPTQIEAIGTLISPYVSRPLAELDPIELTILRIAVFELKNCLEVPYRVIINEALELAKTFGGTDSFKFVNGVLDKVARVVRKEEMSR